MKSLFLLSVIVLAASGMRAEKITRDQVLANGNWMELYTQYSIDPAALKSLKFLGSRNLRIDVYLGFWCPDSARNVPPFIKIIDAIGPGKVQVNFYTVQRKAEGAQYYEETLKVEKVPTFIFYEEGYEIGRIVENPHKSLVEDFLQVIS